MATTTKTSHGSVGLTRQDITITKPLFGQQVSGWITSTQTSDGLVFYGPFERQSEAYEWAINLVNAVVEPVYHPSFNAG